MEASRSLNAGPWFSPGGDRITDQGWQGPVRHRFIPPERCPGRPQQPRPPLPPRPLPLGGLQVPLLPFCTGHLILPGGDGPQSADRDALTSNVTN